MTSMLVGVKPRLLAKAVAIIEAQAALKIMRTTIMTLKGTISTRSAENKENEEAQQKSHTHSITQKC